MRRWQSDYALACKVRGRWFKSNPALHFQIVQHKGNMMITVVGIAIFIALGVAIYKQIPAEDPEIIEAREFYGKAE